MNFTSGKIVILIRGGAKDVALMEKIWSKVRLTKYVNIAKKKSRL